MATVTNPRGTDMNHVLSTTADKYYKSGKMHDAIFNSNPTFAMLKSKGKVEYADGGYQIQVSLMYGKNTTVGSYSGYEVLDIAPQDGITSAFYPWCQYAGSISIDGLTEFQNSGAGRIVKLLGEKVEQTTMTFSEVMNADLFDIEGTSTSAGTTGNSNKNIIGLPLVCVVAPTTASVLGGISGDSDGTNPWWANKEFTHATDTWNGFADGMRTLYNDCSKGYGGAPDVIVGSQGAFELYEESLDQKKRYVKSDRAMADFESIYYKGARVFWDVHMCDAITGTNYDTTPAEETMYHLNTKFLKLMIAKGKDFKPTPFVKPEDQDARVSNYLFYGQLVCSNRRKHGVHHTIEPAITS